MIAKAPKAGKYGTNTVGVLYYLFGRGRANEHTTPHLVAASDPEWLSGGAFADILGRRGGLARLAQELDANMTGHDVHVSGGHVYHVSLSLPRDDGTLGDTRWRELIEDAVRHMGFAPDDNGRGGCRWVAVHHGTNRQGNDHVHLVVNLVRGDGRIASTYRDYPRWRAWCRAVENRHRLTPTSPAGSGRAAASRAELDRANQHARGTERDRLRQIMHTIAASSASEEDFLRLLATSGLRYRPRLSPDNTTVVGYSVALPTTGRPLWISGSSLRRDLSLPRLRADWYDTAEATARAALMWTEQHPIDSALGGMTADASQSSWRRINVQLRTVQDRLTDSLTGDPHGTARWHQTAAYTADVLAVLARHAEQPLPLHRAGDRLSRAGQFPRGQRPPAGTHPVVSLLLGAARMAADCHSPTPVVLAALLLLVHGIVRLLGELAEQHRIHAAARRYLQHAQRQLAQHPALKPQPAEAARLAAAGQAAAALTSPPRRRATGQQPPATPAQKHGAVPRRHVQPSTPTQRPGLTR